MKKNLLLILLFCFGCQSPSTSTEKTKQETLPIVEIRLDSNRYFLPECKKYAEIPKQVLLTLPTIQEAELSGYYPAATCSKEIIKNRLQEEIKIFGKIEPTKETEQRKNQALLRENLDKN